VAVGPARRYLTSTGSISRWQILSFAVAQILLFLAIASPLDQISEQYLFSAHMLQHVILIYPVPLLWLWGTPDWIWRIPLQMEAFAPIVKFVTRPQVAFILFNFIFYVWHLPPMYEWALRDSKIHFLEHATFMGGALLLWWPLVQPLKELPRFHPGSQLLFLLAGSIAQIPLFGILVFSHDALYPTYRVAPRLFADIDAMGDQQLGAAIMKITAMIVMFTSLAVIVLRWYYTEERSGKSRRGAAKAQ
jgi:putative membrane protein